MFVIPFIGFMLCVWFFFLSGVFQSVWCVFVGFHLCRCQCCTWWERCSVPWRCCGTQCASWSQLMLEGWTGKSSGSPSLIGWRWQQQKQVRLWVCSCLRACVLVHVWVVCGVRVCKCWRVYACGVGGWLCACWRSCVWGLEGAGSVCVEGCLCVAFFFFVCTLSNSGWVCCLLFPFILINYANMCLSHFIYLFVLQ